MLVDLETTGFQHEIPEVCTVSIGAVLMGLDGEVEDEFYAVICPSEELIAQARPGAMKVNGFTPDTLRELGSPAEDVWKSFAKWLKDTGITSGTSRYIGQNPGFDLAFIEHERGPIVRKYGWTKQRALDIIDLYSVSESRFIVPVLGKGRRGKSGNSIANALQVDGEPEVHNALEGAKLNYRNFTRLAQINRKWSNENTPT
jgi:DNA polymerase III epsilon subunit-like protein